MSGNPQGASPQVPYAPQYYGGYGGYASPMFGSPAYYNQFSMMPNPQYYGYANTFMRQYPYANPTQNPGWLQYNQAVGLRMPAPSEGYNFGGIPTEPQTPSPRPAPTTSTPTSTQPASPFGGFGSPALDPNDSRYSAAFTYADGGIVSLRRGGYLDGVTDGKADAIPAIIDGRQPAALSDGEFVVPAEVTSALGNGNSNAGARVLYDMVNRIRKDRYGTADPEWLNPEDYLPA